jgi:hypothetical protein
MFTLPHNVSQEATGVRRLEAGVKTQFRYLQANGHSHATSMKKA